MCFKRKRASVSLFLIARKFRYCRFWTQDKFCVVLFGFRRKEHSVCSVSEDLPEGFSIVVYGRKRNSVSSFFIATKIRYCRNFARSRWLLAFACLLTATCSLFRLVLLFLMFALFFPSYFTNGDELFFCLCLQRVLQPQTFLCLSHVLLFCRCSLYMCLLSLKALKTPTFFVIPFWMFMILVSLLFSLEAREKVESYSILPRDDKEAHVAAKACF